MFSMVEKTKDKLIIHSPITGEVLYEIPQTLDSSNLDASKSLIFSVSSNPLVNSFINNLREYKQQKDTEIALERARLLILAEEEAKQRALDWAQSNRLGNYLEAQQKELMAHYYGNMAMQQQQSQRPANEKPESSSSRPTRRRGRPLESHANNNNGYRTNNTNGSKAQANNVPPSFSGDSANQTKRTATAQENVKSFFKNMTSIRNHEVHVVQSSIHSEMTQNNFAFGDLLHTSEPVEGKSLDSPLDPTKMKFVSSMTNEMANGGPPCNANFNASPMAKRKAAEMQKGQPMQAGFYHQTGDSFGPSAKPPASTAGGGRSKGPGSRSRSTYHNESIKQTPKSSPKVETNSSSANDFSCSSSSDNYESMNKSELLKLLRKRPYDQVEPEQNSADASPNEQPATAGCSPPNNKQLCLNDPTRHQPGPGQETNKENQSPSEAPPSAPKPDDLNTSGNLPDSDLAQMQWQFAQFQSAPTPNNFLAIQQSFIKMSNMVQGNEQMQQLLLQQSEAFLKNLQNANTNAAAPPKKENKPCPRHIPHQALLSPSAKKQQKEREEQGIMQMLKEQADYVKQQQIYYLQQQQSLALENQLNQGSATAPAAPSTNNADGTTSSSNDSAAAAALGNLPNALPSIPCLNLTGENLPECRIKRTYSCCFCDSCKTQNPRLYLLHLRVIHQRTNTIYMCPECQYATQRCQKLVRHMKSIHNFNDALERAQSLSCKLTYDAWRKSKRH